MTMNLDLRALHDSALIALRSEARSVAERYAVDTIQAGFFTEVAYLASRERDARERGSATDTSLHMRWQLPDGTASETDDALQRLIGTVLTLRDTRRVVHAAMIAGVWATALVDLAALRDQRARDAEWLARLYYMPTTPERPDAA